ncbi:FCSD flavin-binding domain-containing protein [Zavarzinia compransoris]|uniref:Cytochrome C n=1 Tax=Zavarzinia compransoris TaxID=1264899 RepID=A0A317E6N2_9PROT|nr:FAD/NAD(P)-binding oxidoreductase [Zavarzinia compransoris]PWR22222.1 cytochrome C [Zavarzinia compransoris]TDP47023.1 NADPH-dependent 2,4-dienoyl-CoA reductase/sulfur reductase-like enzyme [Zavarzinia compransoris]
MTKGGIGRRGLLAGAGAALLSRPLNAGTLAPALAVVGGGIAGMTAARRLRALLPAARITVFEPLPAYHACYGANQVLGGWLDDARLRFRHDALARLGIGLVRETVARIDLDGARPRIGGRAFDHVVLAAGVAMAAPAYDGYDPAATPPYWTAGEGILPLRDRIDALPDDATVVMVVPGAPYRCPPAPYERATAIAARMQARGRRGRVVILDAKGSFPKQALFEDAWRRLYPGRVEWLPLDMIGRVTAIAGDAVITATDRFRFDLLHVIPPQTAARVALDSGLGDGTGWVPVTGPAFRHPRAARVSALGDGCIAGDMPKSAFSANAQARVAAATLAAEFLDLPAPAPDLFNTCYSRLAEAETVLVGGPFAFVDGRIKAHDGFISTPGESAEKRKAQTEEAVAWIDLFSAGIFGAGD